MLRWLERTLGQFAIHNLTLVLVCGQGLTFLVNIAQPALYDQMVLVPGLVLQGEVWRLLTFVFLAPLIDPTGAFSAFTILFFIIQLQLLWIFGNALDREWGTFRYNLFLLIGYLATVGAGLLLALLGPAFASLMPVTNAFIYGTVFLAFAFLFPDYTLNLFFIFPVKIKWLALIAWAFYGLQFLTQGWMVRVTVAASVVNFFVFFGKELVQMASWKVRQVRRQAEASASRDEPFHRCTTCGRTDQTDPRLEFRYCPQCTGAPCYCVDHIHNHEHR